MPLRIHYRLQRRPGRARVQRIGHRPHKARGVRAQQMQRRQFLWFLAVGAGVVGAGGALVWMVSAPPRPRRQRAPNSDLLETVPQRHMPSFAQQASPKVQEACRYAVDHGERLQYIPCFCGCTRIGHRHNADCYVAERLADGPHRHSIPPHAYSAVDLAWPRPASACVQPRSERSGPSHQWVAL